MRILAIVLGLFIASPALAQDAFWKSVGWWEVNYLQEYGGCSAIAQFQNGTYVFIGLDTTTQNLGLRVALLNEKWQSLAVDQPYQVDVQFDRRAPWEVTMYGMEVEGSRGLYNLFPATSDSSARFLREFRRSVHMVWDYNGNELGDFSLKSTNIAIQEVIACTEHYMKSGGTDPFAGGGGSADPFQ